MNFENRIYVEKLILKRDFVMVKNDVLKKTTASLAFGSAPTTLYAAEVEGGPVVGMTEMAVPMPAGVPTTTFEVVNNGLTQPVIGQLGIFNIDGTYTADTSYFGQKLTKGTVKAMFRAGMRSEVTKKNSILSEGNQYFGAAFYNNGKGWYNMFGVAGDLRYWTTVGVKKEKQGKCYGICLVLCQKALYSAYCDTC